MNPLTPDHHFYIDQGTNARVRLVLVAIGRKLVAEGRLDDPEDVMYLQYNELRRLMAGSNAFDAESCRRPPRRPRGRLRAPPAATGSAPPPRSRSRFPYWSLWAFPEKLYRRRPSHDGEIQGLAASAGVVEGTARVVLSRRAVRRGRARRDHRLPDDQPLVGGAVHQDLRPGHRRRRHGLAPGRRLPRVRHPGRRRHLRRDPPDQDRRPVRVNGSTGVVEILS